MRPKAFTKEQQAQLKTIINTIRSKRQEAVVRLPESFRRNSDGKV